MKHATLLLAALLGLSQCKKKEPGPAPTPESLLPPATQTGANTFGCLLNGQLWTPAGADGTSNYSVYYDPSFGGGSFNITTYRYSNNKADTKQSISIGMSGLTRECGQSTEPIEGGEQVSAG